MKHAGFIVVFLAAFTALAVAAPLAQAGRAASDQYRTTIEADGTVDRDTKATIEWMNRRLRRCQNCNGDGTFQAGEVLIFQGDFKFNPNGFSLKVRVKSTGQVVTITFDHAIIRLGSLELEAKQDIPGMTDDVDDFEVIDLSGITLAAEAASSDDGVLPRTGGEFAWLISGLLILMGAAYGLRRATRPAPSSEQ